MKKCQGNFISNGRLLQVGLISFCNGKNLPIHIFSAKDIMRMSQFTHKELLHWDSTFKLYNGVMGNQRIYIKKFYSGFFGMEVSSREIVAAAQMGVYRNSLKLLGCCLETDFPILIYEFPERGCLAHQIYGKTTCELHWKIRLKIAYEIAYALAYLQNGFHTPVIHRNLSARDVFLDENYVAKIFGFFLSVSIPEGEEHLMDAVVGTNGYSEPEYMVSGRLTKTTDVFLFGVLFLELLAKRRWLDMKLSVSKHPSEKVSDHCRDGRMDKLLDEGILEEIKGNRKQQEVVEVLQLISRCLASKGDDRPDIVDVATALKKFL